LLQIRCTDTANTSDQMEQNRTESIPCHHVASLYQNRQLLFSKLSHKDTSRINLITKCLLLPNRRTWIANIRMVLNHRVPGDRMRKPSDGQMLRQDPNKCK